jgi:hypothetical protein
MYISPLPGPGKIRANFCQEKEGCFKFPFKTKLRYYIKLVMKSCHSLFMKMIVVGLSYFWRAHMVCVGWIQHIVN